MIHQRSPEKTNEISLALDSLKLPGAHNRINLLAAALE